MAARCDECGRFAPAGMSRCGHCTQAPTSAGTVTDVLADVDAFLAAEAQSVTDLMNWVLADMANPLENLCTDKLRRR